MWKVADLNVLPHKVEILGIGIAKDKTNKTGETEWTGITPNARADRDPVGGLADLLAHEIAINNFGLIDMIRTGHPQLWQSRMWFSKSEQNGVGEINSLINQWSLSIFATFTILSYKHRQGAGKDNEGRLAQCTVHAQLYMSCYIQMQEN